jgi:ribonuclease E
MTVVDVNTGKFTGSGGNLEQTVTRNNLEAAEEIVRQLRLRDIGGIVVIDFIDMVLESNRDLVLRRLTESLARDRTRHQVSEVTSLGLVQLTRKRLGTGLIEAFSTPCPQCAGRGILLHGDPVDSGSATGRSASSGGRRGKRGKKGGRPEDVAVATVPVHPAGEHPMFKAMAAANGRHEDEDEDEGEKAAEEVAELDPGTVRAAVVDAADEELEDDDFDESDEDEIDLDADDEDEDIDDDIEVINVDDEDSDDFDDAEDAEDADEADEADEPDYEEGDVDEEDDVDRDDELETEPPVVTAQAGRHRRRAAARPAGPPVHED